jgi:hypothetical protein
MHPSVCIRDKSNTVNTKLLPKGAEKDFQENVGSEEVNANREGLKGSANQSHSRDRMVQKSLPYWEQL